MWKSRITWPAGLCLIAVLAVTIACIMVARHLHMVLPPFVGVDLRFAELRHGNPRQAGPGKDTWHSGAARKLVVGYSGTLR